MNQILWIFLLDTLYLSSNNCPTLFFSTSVVQTKEQYCDLTRDFWILKLAWSLPPGNSRLETCRENVLQSSLQQWQPKTLKIRVTKRREWLDPLKVLKTSSEKRKQRWAVCIYIPVRRRKSHCEGKCSEEPRVAAKYVPCMGLNIRYRSPWDYGLGTHCL